jgi:predicted restriction endonuclease
MGSGPVILRQSENSQRLSITLSDETIKKLNRLKQLTQKQDTEVILNLALDEMIQNIEEQEIKESRQKPTARAATGRLRTQVMKRAQYQCQFPGCDEMRHLQVDHMRSFSKGGTTNAANLQILCSTHNRWKGRRL